MTTRQQRSGLEKSILGRIPRRLLNRCKMVKTYIGIDNGSTGSIGIIREDGKVIFGTIPNKKEQSYTKKEQSVTRVDVIELTKVLERECGRNNGLNHTSVFILIERPLVNPGMFKATLSAMRALEAVLNTVEMLN